MRLLIINQYAGSPHHGMEYRPYYLAREWVRNGHCVTIVAGTPSHLRHHNPRPSFTAEGEDVDGINYVWLPTPSYRRNGIRRALSIYSFAWQVWREAKRLARRLRPDVVIASSTHPLDLRGAARTARAAKATLVYEVHDLWPLTLIEVGGMSRRNPFIWHLQREEEFGYRSADVVVSILPSAEPHMVAHGLDPRKFVHIPNGFVSDEWAGERLALPEPHVAADIEDREAGRFRIGYAGGHGTANALDDLLDAAALLAGEPVSFTLVGEGPEKRRLQDRVAAEGLSNVRFVSGVEKRLVPAVLRSFDALYLGWEPKPIYRFGISPNKLTDYFMAAVPVIHASPSKDDPVVLARAGVSVAAGSPREIARGIEDLRRRPRQELDEMGRNGRRYAEAKLNYGTLAERFLGAVDILGARRE